MQQLNYAFFGVTHWDDASSPTLQLLHEWQRRLFAFTPAHGGNTFLSLGNKSPAELNPTEIRTIDMGLPKTLEYSNNWSYLMWGFVAGLYYSLHAYPSATHIVHVQDRTFLGQLLSDMLAEHHAKEIAGQPSVAAPAWSCYYVRDGRPTLDTGFIVMNRQAALLYLSQRQRPIMTLEAYTIGVEEELTDLFESCGVLPTYLFGEGTTTRAEDGMGGFNMTRKECLAMPVIAAGKHCPPDWCEAWKEKHPMPEAKHAEGGRA